MKVVGLTLLFKNCIVQFLVFWGPDKFGIKKILEVPPPPRWHCHLLYRFSYITASFTAKEKKERHNPLLHNKSTEFSTTKSSLHPISDNRILQRWVNYFGSGHTNVAVVPLSLKLPTRVARICSRPSYLFLPQNSTGHVAQR